MPVLIFALVLAATCSWAQTYPVRVYSEADGLASSSVYDVEQGPEGRMWFATRGGVCVFDGTEWSTFSLANGLPTTGYYRLSVEDDGTVWALNNSPTQVFRYDGERWSSLPLLRREAGRLENLSVFDTVRFAAGTYPVIGTRSSLFLWNGEAWRELESGPVLALASRPGRLFFGTEAGLFELTDPAGAAVPVDQAGLPPGPIRALAVEGPSDLWIAGDGWLARRRGEGVEVLDENLPLFTAVPGFVRLEADGAGGAYLADREKILHRDAQGRLFPLGATNGLSAAGATGLELGRDGILWLATERGASKLVSRRFATYRQVDGLVEDEVSAILEPEPGVLLFGHNRGLTRLEDGRATATKVFEVDPMNPISHMRVMDLARGADGTVWALTNRAGVWRLPEGDPARAVPVDGLPESRPFSFAGLAFDHRDHLWIGGGSGLLRFDGERFHDETPSLPVDAEDLVIRRLHAEPGGRLFAATVRHGLLIRDAVGWQAARLAGGDAPSLYTVLTTSKGEVWVGAFDGLYRLAGDHLERSRRPSVERPVYALSEDDAGRLWVGTDYGVMRFDGRESRAFGIREGLAGHEINRAALTLDHGGHLWVGTNRGASRYDERFDLPPRALTPRLDGVELASGFESLDEPLELAWNHNNLTFRFRAISLLGDDAVEFSGRLEGFDADFQPAGRAVGRRMHYTNLPPGSYRFQLRARVHDTDWGPVVSSPVIRIGSPFWRRTWFYLAVVATALLTLGGALRHVATRRHSRQLEHLVGERTRELVASNERLRREIEEHRSTEIQLRLAKASAEEANSAKSSFLAVMSHEIRTPMTGVLGIVDLLEHSTLDDDQRELVVTLRRAGEALLAILDDILDYSRIEAGRLEIEHHPFDLRAVLDDVVALFAAQASKKDVDLRAEVAAEIPERLLGDSSRLRQVLANLVGNAIKFTRRGAVELRCRATSSRGGAPRLVIEAQDSGIGIPEEHLESLFEPFQQVDSSAGRRHGGTGLGLAICQRLVHAMNGTIEVTSTIGEGSTFRVELPLEAVEATEIVRLEEPRLAAPSALRILVAEDNPMVQQITLGMLGALGYRADLAANGLEVLEALESGAYDMILMDVQMPILDGLETARRICARWPDRPPIVAVTAHALRGDRESCLQAGMDDYLAKPVTLSVLGTKIREWTEVARSA